MKTEKWLEVIDKAIETGFRFLFFLTPLVLTPWNFELFEFNKMVFVFLITTVIVAAWVMKMALTKKFIFTRTFWDWPLAIFIVTQSIGTVFSLDPHTSFWGYYTRMHGGLASTLAYALLYWAIVSNLARTQIKQLLKLLILSGLLVAGYGILERFGIDKNYWQQDVQNRVFSTLGQPNWLAAWLGMIFFLPLVFGDQKSKRQLFYYFIAAIYFFCLIFTQSKSGFTGLALSWLLFWWLGFTKNKSNQKKFWLTSLVLIIILLVIKNPVQDLVFEKLNLRPVQSLPPGIHISSSGNIRQVVWKGALEIWKKSPLIGTGTETFGYSYYQSRPAEHNLLSEWDFLFNKAHNEYLNFLANNGLIGLIAYLALAVSYLAWLFKNRRGPHRQRKLLAALGAGFTGLLATNFFGFSVVATGLLFFLYPALSFGLTTNQQNGLRPKLKKTTVLVLVGIVACLACFRFGQIWWADIQLARSEENLQIDLNQLALENLRAAIRLRPNEPLFHDKYAVAAASVAYQAYQQEQSALAQQLAEISLAQSDLALTLNPYQLNHWKNRARIFINLAPIDSKYLLEAAETLQTAIKFAPTDAKIYYNLALIYHQLEQDQLAIQTLEKTIELKTNYKDARFALAYFLHEQGHSAEAINQLVYITDQIDPTDETIKKLIEEWQP